MTIRIAEMADVPELVRMNILLREDERMDNVLSADEIRIRMEMFLASADFRVYVFSDAETVPGYCVLELNRKPLYVRQLFVKRECRGKGIGSACLKEIMSLQGADEIDIDVMEWNENAIAFYERFGFRKRYVGMRFSGASG